MNKTTEKILKHMASLGYYTVLRQEVLEFRTARQLILAGICHEDYERSTGSYIIIKFGKATQS
jgi:hypothetical protein